MPTIGVYLIRNPKKRVYVGKSINVERRLKQYAKADCKSQPKIFRSILKYGWENHEVSTIICKEENLDECEKYFISWHKTIKYGLNCLPGGVGGKRFTEDQRRRLSESRKGLFCGEKNPMWGKKWSQASKDSRKKWLDANKEEIREKSRKSSSGRVYNEESRNKKSNSLKGHSVSQEVKGKIRNSRSKIVLQFTLEGTFIREWESVKIAEHTTGYCSISSAASGKAKQMCGFIWKYKDPSPRKHKRMVGKYNSDGELIDTYQTIRMAAATNKINPSDISQVCQGNAKTARGFFWKYLD